jgi:hypothetical protein
MRIGSITSANRPYGTRDELKQRRDELAERILPLYESGKSHKTIAKEIGAADRIVRTILIERGAWSPKRPGTKNASARYSRHRECNSPRWLITRNSHLITSTAKTWMKSRDAQRPNPRASKWKGFMDRYRNDPEFKVKCLLRKRIRKVVQRGDKSASTLELLGCTRAHFMAHIESQFTKGMTWANLGIGKGCWNLDHVQPCASFTLSNPEHQRICFHWTNIRPMWAISNLKKGDQMTDPSMSLRLDC